MEEKEKAGIEIADKITRRLCSKVRELRKSKGLTLEELGEQAGMFNQAISRLESGKHSPKVDLLARVLEPMGYTIDIVRIEDVE